MNPGSIGSILLLHDSHGRHTLLGAVPTMKPAVGNDGASRGPEWCPGFAPFGLVPDLLRANGPAQARDNWVRAVGWPVPKPALLNGLAERSEREDLPPHGTRRRTDSVAHQAEYEVRLRRGITLR